MKKQLSLLLCILLLALLCACGGSPSPSQSSSVPAEDPQSTASAPEENGTDPLAVSEPESIFDADEPVLALCAEYNRLYAVSATDGDSALLIDEFVYSFTRCGDRLIAVLDNGRFAEVEPASMRVKITDTDIPGPAYRVYRFDGGYVIQTFSMTEGEKVFVLYDGNDALVELFPDEYVSQVAVTRHRIILEKYRNDVYSRLALDAKTLETLWETEILDSSSVTCINDTVYLIRNSDKLFILDPDTGELRSVPCAMRQTDSELLYVWNGALLIESSYSYDHGIYLLRGDERACMLKIQSGQYVNIVDAADGTVLIRITEYLPGEVSERWYESDRYILLDMETGEERDLDFRGEYASLFADGDFPLMDSSTARKPLTADIYSFFCEMSGAGGQAPLCSTTHKAWLNVADGTVDIALLAAPTQEELDYIEDCGTSVEMKLYGGDGLVFIGNRACGVTDLTLEQIRSIYRGEITNWSDLGGVNAPIHVLYRDDQSGSQRLFERMLWAGEAVPDQEALGFDRLDEMSSIVNECLRDPYAVGYSIMTYLSDVYGREDLLCFSLEGYEATPENVAARLYPLGTQGYVVIRADEAEGSPARRLFNWFGSPLSDYILAMNGVTPLHGE